MPGMHTFLAGMGKLTSKPLMRMVGFGALGYAVGEATGQNPWGTAVLGAGFGAFAPTQLFKEAGERATRGRFGRRGFMSGRIGRSHHLAWDPKAAKVVRRPGSIESALPHRAFMTPRAEMWARSAILTSAVAIPLYNQTIGAEYQRNRIARDRRIQTVGVDDSYDFSALQSSVSRAPTMGATGDIVLGSHRSRGGVR